MAAIRGLAQAQADLRALQTKVKQAQKRGGLKGANLIANDAKARAKGTLAQKIYVTQDEVKTTVIGGDELSAYNEFGTGDFASAYLASMPPEVKEEAIKFYVDGSGKIPAAPFFFPSIYKNKDNVIRFVQEELNKIK